MAYTPRTWDNEVITDAKLNQIEQGVADASTLTGTDIDDDKDWNGKNITNIGDLQTQTGNVGARSEYVDVPGAIDRKQWASSVPMSPSSSADVLTFTVPDNYDAITSSNARIRVAPVFSQGGGTLEIWTVTVKNGATPIGSASGTPAAGAIAVDTTGGFVAGDTITITLSTTSVFVGISSSTITYQSARSLVAPVYKRFDEAVWE